MRFLAVYKDYAEEARRLVKDLAVSDVRVVVLGNGRKVEDKGAVAQLSEQRGAPTATVSVNRKLQRSLEDDFGCILQVNFQSIKGAGRGLVDWLVPVQVAPAVEPFPEDALKAVSEIERRVVIAHNALLYANDLPEHRYPFVRRASEALRELAQAGCSAPGGLERFFVDRKVQFAVNGPVEVTAHVWRGGSEVEKQTTEWHLKEGDATTRAAAARLYFCISRIDGTGRVLVLYCGPHPDAALSSYVYL